MVASGAKYRPEASRGVSPGRLSASAVLAPDLWQSAAKGDVRSVPGTRRSLYGLPYNGEMAADNTGIDYWTQHLAEVQLPLLSDAAALEAMLDPGVSPQALARLLRADLPLALDALLIAARLPSVGGEPQGLVQAIGLLGVVRTQNLVRARMDRLLEPARPAHRGFLQALSVSRFAALLVERWEGARQPGGGEALFWTTLALGAVRCRLPLLAPRAAAEIEQRVRRGERRARAEQAVLGCHIAALGPRLLRALGLVPDPGLIDALRADGRRVAMATRGAWTGAFPPEPDGRGAAVAAWLKQRHALCALGHELAWAAWDGWYHGHTATLMAALSAQLHWPVDKVIASSHQTAARASRSFVHAGLVVSPAEQLFWPPPPPRKLLRVTAQGKQGAAPGRAATPPPAVAERVDAVRLQRFRDDCAFGRFRDSRALLAATMGVLKDGLGLPRALLFLKLVRTDVLRCQIVHGVPGAPEPAKLETPSEGEDLLARLFRHAGALHVDARRLAVARQQMPECVRPLLPGGGLLLACVKVGGRPVGVLWADAGEGPAPDEAQYAAFRQLVDDFGEAFGRLARSGAH